MDALLDLLNLVDSGFPTGAFGHSAGLEYAIQAGWVTDGADLASWARGSLERSFFPLDLRSALKAWHGEGLDWGDLNRQTAAFRTSRAQREAQAQVGRSFLRSVEAFYPDLGGPLWTGAETWFRSGVDPDAVQFCLAWGLVCRGLGIGALDMAEALVFSALRQMTLVAMRLIPLGQKEAFTVQTRVLRDLDLAPVVAPSEVSKPLESLAPGFDLAGLGMENLSSRYFRS